MPAEVIFSVLVRGRSDCEQAAVREQGQHRLRLFGSAVEIGELWCDADRHVGGCPPQRDPVDFTSGSANFRHCLSLIVWVVCGLSAPRFRNEVIGVRT